MSNEDEHPEYREKLRERIGYYANTILPKPEQMINSSSTKSPIIPQRVQNSIGLASNFNPEKNITILDFWSMEHVENVQFPSPCKEFPSSETSIAQTIYCYTLIALWLLLLATALTYQLRKFIKVKDNGKDIELGEIQRKDSNLHLFDENGHFTNRQNLITQQNN
ncbi:unnamed protein product [Meloidogyne enterolobii]|uniref:Uncharacterized protein n=1 Tax=Meloidogyne enterolobii TaxID=390850 RepID=A0ACB0Z980_MELEN